MINGSLLPDRLKELHSLSNKGARCRGSQPHKLYKRKETEKMKIYCGKCGGAYDDQFVVCPHCGNIREEQQANYMVEEIKSEPPKSKK